MSAFAMVLASISILLSVVLFSQIRDTRRDSIVIACQEQNRRHDFALIVTNRLLARPATPQRPLTPQERAARDAAIRTWVNALVPEQDCERRADRLLNP